MEQDPYRVRIHEILEKVADRALLKLVGMIPDNNQLEWYVAFCLSCPTWYVVDFVKPTDLTTMPAKQQRKTLDCLGMMTFLPSILWGGYLKHQVNHYASTLKAQREYVEEVRATRRAAYSGGIPA